MTEPSKHIRALIDRGVDLPDPAAVCIDASLDPERIAPDARILPGCRLAGKTTSIGPGCVLGEEAPVTVEDCQLGEGVVLKGGFFSGATFLAGASFGSCAHVRPGTLLEEQASCAHTVGLKQTVLMPFVTAGSLINFCDCLMAGGTSRSDHSEVGSSYVHFNFTPNHDKATASLIGDVPRGVMLDQPPIFLGGQGGLVGPGRIEYGMVVAAGMIIRRDHLEGGQLVFGQPTHAHGHRPFKAGVYGDIRRIVDNCIVYLGNIHALYQWYVQIRSTFLDRNPYDRACFEGACTQLRRIANERVKRLDELAGKVADGLSAVSGAVRDGQEAFVRQWPKTAPKLAQENGIETTAEAPDILMHEIRRGGEEEDYIDAVQALTPAARKAGTAWLQCIVDRVCECRSM